MITCQAMPFSTFPPRSLRQHSREAGVVLPMALIMLVIISFAGLLAARNSASHEQFSNNMRTTQVARQMAEAALRHCEAVVIDLISNEGEVYGSLRNRIVDVESPTLTLDTVEEGHWNNLDNWSSGAANLITYTPAFTNAVKDEAQIKSSNHPTCMVQAMTEDRFLVTARGLSNDATLTNNVLTRGSEIWLQSVLTPGVPIKSASGGYETPGVTP